MIRSAVSADILDVIRACFGPERCRDYVFARTRGIPPADCNSIAASWVDRSVTQVGGDKNCADLEPCGDGWDSDLTLRITITNICMGPDGKPTFDWKLEDAVAACFDDDVDKLEECIQCADWTPFRAEHRALRVKYLSTTYDVQTEGGGFSAYIDVQVLAAECCA